MDVVNFGSLNIDYVYSVGHIVAPGETISSAALEVFPGGKGLNQSIALARAGAKVSHAGMIGEDGRMLAELLEENGVDTHFIRTARERTGNAIIQLADSGQNSIVLYGGANRALTDDYIDDVLSSFDAGTMVLLQNETNACKGVIEKAYGRGMKIALNPSPYDEGLRSCDLSKVSFFLLNEIEGEQITGASEPGDILDAMEDMYPGAVVVLTLGEDGAVLRCRDGEIRQGIYPTTVVDTTAAGDTFTGYFLAAVISGCGFEKALDAASKAASIAISVKGAANSIPSAAYTK